MREYRARAGLTCRNNAASILLLVAGSLSAVLERRRATCGIPRRLPALSAAPNGSHVLKSAPQRGIPSDPRRSASPRNVAHGLKSAPRAIRGISSDSRRSASPRIAPRGLKSAPRAIRGIPGDPRHPASPRIAPHSLKSVPRAIRSILGDPRHSASPRIAPEASKVRPGPSTASWATGCAFKATGSVSGRC